MLISYHLTYVGIGIRHIGAQISYPVNVERNLHWNAWRRILVQRLREQTCLFHIPQQNHVFMLT